MSKIKRRRSNVEEKKIGGSYKMRKSVKDEAMELIKTDQDIKSFNNLLEVAVIAYIKVQKELKTNEDQGKLKL